MFHSHGNTLTVRKFEGLTVQTFEKRKTKRCEHHNHLNFCLARAWLHGCVVTRLGDAILDFRRVSVLHVGRWKNNWKKILKLVRKFRVKKAKMLNGSVFGQIFQPVENSSGAFLTYLTSHPTRSRLIAEKKINKRYLWGLQLRWRWLPPAEQ